MSHVFQAHEHDSLAHQVRVGPQGHSPLLGGFRKPMLAVGRWSPMAVRGEGWKLWDHTSQELIELPGAFTVNVHCSAYPAVESAVSNVAANDMMFGLPSRYEIEHAQNLVSRRPHLDQVRNTSSGTEALQLAESPVRVHTGRSKVIVANGSYRGREESLLPTMGPRAQRGIPTGMLDETVVVGFNDVTALKATVLQYPKQIEAMYPVRPSILVSRQVAVEHWS